MGEDKTTGQMVLVVGNSADARGMMRQFLKSEGYRVAEVREVLGERYGYIPKPVDLAHLKILNGRTFGNRL